MGSDAILSLSRIGQICVMVTDLPRAIAFYRDVLGIPFLFDAPGMAFFACGDVRLMLGVAESPEFEGATSIIYYRVDDIDGAHAALVERGVTFEHEPRVVHRTETSELHLAFFRDSEDNPVALMSETSVA